MKSKPWHLLILTLFVLAFFSSIKIIAVYYYHIQMTHGNQTLAMTIMDKASAFNLSSYAIGMTHGGVIIVMLMIMLNK